MVHRSGSRPFPDLSGQTPDREPPKHHSGSPWPWAGGTLLLEPSSSLGLPGRAGQAAGRAARADAPPLHHRPRRCLRSPGTPPALAAPRADCRRQNHSGTRCRAAKGDPRSAASSTGGEQRGLTAELITRGTGSAAPRGPSLAAQPLFRSPSRHPPATAPPGRC